VKNRHLPCDALAERPFRGLVGSLWQAPVPAGDRVARLLALSWFSLGPLSSPPRPSPVVAALWRR